MGKIVMGKLKSLLLELESEGRITWSDSLRGYVSTEDEHTLININDYVHAGKIIEQDENNECNKS